MMNLNLKFNLRTKLIIGFTAFLIVSSWINFMFLRDFDSFQKNVTMLTYASNISNMCLEIRRYEKNFIIGNAREDYDTVLEFIERLSNSLDRADKDIDDRDREILNDLRSKVREYAIHFNKLSEECAASSNLADCRFKEPVQKVGAAAVALAEALVVGTQQEVENFARESKIKLTLYFSFLIVFSLCGMIVFFITIGKRLKSLESAAKAIATGDYHSLPESKLNDEVQIVFKAFDQMVEVLEERQELLFQAEKMSSLGTLASGVAHQLNNPLNNIATSCQLAIEEVEEPDSREFMKKLLTTINDETERAAIIVKGLLEFSRRDLFSLKPSSLRTLVRKAVTLVLSDVPSGIRIIQDVPEELMITIDEQKMKEVFINLIINGIQSIKEDTGSVVIAAECDLDTDAIVITVSDTGMGIAEEFRQQVFDPFYTTKEVGKGTGLGLSVVYGIIKKHNGTITVRNNKDKGTTFLITLPQA